MSSCREQPIAATAGMSRDVPEFGGVVATAFAAACAAQTVWSRTTIPERLRLVRALRALVAQHGHELADSSATVRRQPVSEAMVAEVIPLAEACRFLERNATRILRARRFGANGRPLWLSGVVAEVRREPCGIVLVIGPGNYPLLLPGVQIIQALVAGNAVVFKPGAGGLPAAERLRRLLEHAGFDPRLVQVLPEAPEAARRALAARSDKVVFTGSAEVGEKILTQLALQLVPATMELSGCDAMIVRADADLDLVVKALRFGLSLNNGATCLAPKRIFVAAPRATELEGRLANAWQGAGTLRPLTGALKSTVDDLVARGAHFITGGLVDEKNIRLPAVLGGASPASRFLREDVFEPLAAVITVADDHEAVMRANDCPYGLGASIFSKDETAAQELAARLNVGVVTINDLLLPTADARLPFGGRGRSGFGSTRGAEGLLDLTVPKVVTISRAKFRPAFAPPHLDDAALFQDYLTATHQRGLGLRIKAAVRLVLNLLRRRKTT